MKIEDLKHPSILRWQYSDICEMTSEQQGFLNLAPEIIDLIVACSNLSCAWPGQDWMESEAYKKALRRLNDKLESM